MNKNKKYKYNITLYRGFSDNITNKLSDMNFSYNPINIIEAIDNNYNDMNMFNKSKTINTNHEQQTKIRQDELIRKEKARLNRIKANSMTKEEEEDELYKKNKK